MPTLTTRDYEKRLESELKKYVLSMEERLLNPPFVERAVTKEEVERAPSILELLRAHGAVRMSINNAISSSIYRAIRLYIRENSGGLFHKGASHLGIARDIEVMYSGMVLKEMEMTVKTYLKIGDLNDKTAALKVESEAHLTEAKAINDEATALAARMKALQADVNSLMSKTKGGHLDPAAEAMKSEELGFPEKAHALEERGKAILKRRESTLAKSEAIQKELIEINAQVTNGFLDAAGKEAFKARIESGITATRFNPKGNYANLCRALVNKFDSIEGWRFSDPFKAALSEEPPTPALKP